MATLEEVVFFFFFSSSFFFFYLPYRATSVVEINPNLFCFNTGPEVRFPFWLRNCPTFRCGYPGFELSCNNRSQKILHLPHSGDFVVQNIDYAAQEIWVNDPDGCLAKRFIDGFSRSASPFNASTSVNYEFLNCSSNTIMVGFTSIPCLSSENYTVMGVPSRFNYGFLPPSCSEIATTLVPRQWAASLDPSSDVRLDWSEPACGSCEERGGVCGFKSDTGISLEIGCSNLPSHGLSRGAKYGIIIGVGIPGLVCIIGLACLICGRIRTYGRRRHPNTEFSTSIAPQPAIVLVGLDGPTIESFPKTVLGESRRLPKPSDGTCPICLSEYQPKDTLRTIPECNHYFHADCVDEWLRLNGTCPLCRNSPDGSSLITPCTSSSSSSS